MFDAVADRLRDGDSLHDVCLDMLASLACIEVSS